MSDPLDAKILAKGRFLQLLDQDTWEYVDRFGASGVVDVVAITPEDHLVLVEQFRPAANARVIETPAGLIGDDIDHEGEGALDAARRELLEETGYHAGHLEQVAKAMVAPGHSTETAHVFLATDLVKASAGGGVADECITIHVVPLTGIHSWLEKQIVRGVKVGVRVYTGLYFASQYLAKRQN